ncbi:hypothetical protein LCGC14_0434350 [marine sediment metagenome]|uniref:Uncharacterized protein n=1 Tax=marine sediment metagenome TaxID=412755 RepID=A0A0F9SM78_9ZZZZ
MNYVGDFVENAIVYVTFNTFDSNDPSASVTITDLVAGDVQIFKDGVIQTTPGAGVTLSLNLGANNGSHLIAIDTSNTTDGGFYVTGADYQVRINGTTVDAGTINAWVGTFSIENRSMRGTDGANTTVPDAAGVAPTATEIIDEFETQSQADPTGFHVNTKEVNGTAQTANDNGADINAILIDTNEIQGKLPTNKFMGSSDGADDDGTLNTIATDAARLTAARAGALTDWINGGRLDLILDIIAADTTTDIPALIATAQSDLDTITGATGVLIDTDAVDADALKADAVTEIWAKAMKDLAQGAPSATASVLDAINWMYEAFRNKSTTTATLFTLLKDDGSTALSKSTISDDGSIFTKGEMVSGA